MDEEYRIMVEEFHKLLREKQGVMCGTLAAGPNKRVELILDDDFRGADFFALIEMIQRSMSEQHPGILTEDS